MRLPTSLICLAVLSYGYASPLESASCAAATGTASACHSGVLVLFDATNDVTGGSLNLQNSWDFVANQLMPAMDNKAAWSFAAYGDQDRLNNDCPVFVTPPTSSPSDICASLDDVHAELLSKDVFAAMNLTTVAKKVQQCMGTNKFNLLLLITENKDQTDIQTALSIFKSQGVDVVVVNLGSGDFSPVQSLCPKQPLGQQPQKDIIDGLLNAFCGKPVGPLGCKAAPVPPETSCPCYYESAWLDIFVLIDGSTNIGSSSFAEAKSFMASVLTPVSIGQGLKQTRVGSIVYADGAQQISRLSSFKSTSDMQMSFLGLKFPNQDGTNIDSATDIARDSFEDPKEHRPNARKVIVIHASTFREDSNYTETQQFAATFKKNNGIIIVILHGDDHGHVVPVLKNIASVGYFFDLSVNPDPTALVQFFKQSLCDANCFCTGVFYDKKDNQEPPKDGCFWSAAEPISGALLGKSCELQHGYAALTKTKEQRAKVAKARPKTKFLVGLTYNTTSEQWLWADNTVFEPVQYDPVLDHTNGNCAVIQSANGFLIPVHAESCDDFELYGCQMTACSTAHFCSDP